MQQQVTDARRRPPPVKRAARRAARHFDLVVLGGTPGGIAVAVRAAREGLRVALAAAGRHLGGMLSGGLGGFDTLYDRPRAPLVDEFVARVRAHYRTTYGENSPQYAAATAGRRLRFEPHVAEQVLEKLVGQEPRLCVLRECRVWAVDRSERRLLAVLVEFPDGIQQRLDAQTFADCTYEGDLAALSGVPYHLGREGSAEFGEPHAGRVFTVHGWYHCPREAGAGRLNLATFGAVSQEIFSGSTGEGDGAIQAYNARLCLTSDPQNRRPIPRPDDYDRARYLGIVEEQGQSLGKRYPLKAQLLLTDVREMRLHPSSWAAGMLPNGKMSYNDANFPGENHRYPTAGWPDREAIARRHVNHALGQLYFLQHDPAVPAHVREEASQWGLARDEFAGNNNLPYEIYVREARRIRGRYTFTEHDGSVAPGMERAPIHQDAIAFTEWPMDSHECTTERVYGSLYDGKFLLTEKTRPGQVPYRALLPEGLDNLLVPVCLSCTHVGWGTIRLEPTWMHIGEAAGLAAALATRTGTSVGALGVEALQRALLRRGVALAFFNDAGLAGGQPWERAVQYLATKGFFPTYDARPAAPLTRSTAVAWARAAGTLLDETGGSHTLAAPGTVGEPAADHAAGRARAIYRAEPPAAVRPNDPDAPGGQQAEVPRARGKHPGGEPICPGDLISLLARELSYRDLDPSPAAPAVASAVPVEQSEHAPLSRAGAALAIYTLLARCEVDGQAIAPHRGGG